MNKPKLPPLAGLSAVVHFLADEALYEGYFIGVEGRYWRAPTLDELTRILTEQAKDIEHRPDRVAVAVLHFDNQPQPDKLAKISKQLAAATKKSEIRRLHRQFFVAWYGAEYCNKPDVKKFIAEGGKELCALDLADLPWRKR